MPVWPVLPVGPVGPVGPSIPSKLILYTTSIAGKVPCMFVILISSNLPVDVL
jgi:hypothetical protein